MFSTMPGTAPQAISHVAKKREAAATTTLAPRQENFLASWGLDAWDWGRTLASPEAAGGTARPSGCVGGQAGRQAGGQAGGRATGVPP